MMLHVYVFGIGVILSHGGIIWMALWRKLYWFVGVEAIVLVFGLWLWNFSEPPLQAFITGLFLVVLVLVGLGGLVHMHL
jgi:hypothetical protein